MQTGKIVYFNIFFPIIFGGVIYTFFRDYKPESLTFILNLVDLNVSLDPKIYLSGNKYFNSWFVYSLPDGLWAYSLTYFIAYTNNKILFKNKIYWLLATYLLICFQEIFQGSILNGTYDFNDMVSLNFGFFLALVVFKKLTGNNK